MKRWLKLGKIPESCSEPEDLTEGPAMCITDQSNDNRGSPTMIVGGALGSDGKPVKIKVELPVNIQKMLKKEQQKKQKRSTREGNKSRIAKSNDRQSRRGGKEEHTFVFSEEEEEDFLDDSSSDEDGDILDLPDSLRTYILKKAARQTTPSKSLRHLKSLTAEHQGSTNFANGWSMSDFTTSSLSSLASKVDSEEFLKYLESGDSGDVFLSDFDYSSNSQIDMVGGENVSKPIKKKLSKGAVETLHCSSSDGVEMLYSSDNGAHLASTKSRSKVRNDKKIGKRRSRSFPESKGLESSSTHLPLIQGAQSSHRYSIRKHQRKPKYNHGKAKNSDEALDLNGLEGRSFHGLANPSTDSFVHEEDVGSSTLKPEGGVNKDKNDRKKSSHQYSTRSAMRGKARKQSQHDGGDKTENELRLPNIFDDSGSPMNPSSISNTQDSKFGADEGQNSENPSSRNSQSLHLPHLNKDRGVIAQQAAEGGRENVGEVTLSNDATSNVDWRTNHGNSKTKSSMNMPQSLPKSNQDGFQSNSVALENEHREDFKSQSRTHFMVTDTSQSMLSARSSSVTMGGRRGSVNNPLAPIENNQKRRPSRVSQATVQQDVEITVGRSNKSKLRPPPRQRRAKQSDEMPSLHRLSENNLNKTLSSHLPEKPGSARRPSMEMSSFHTDDSIPRRIGHKLIKKKKGDEHQRDSVMHNSKDIGNIVEGTEAADGNNAGAVQSTTSKRPSLIPGLVEEFNSFAQSPLANSLKANQDAGYSSNWTTSNTPGVGGSGAPSGAKLRPMSGGMGSRQSAANYTAASTTLQENSGTPSMLPPVRLKPLDPTQVVNLDPTSTTGIQPLQVIGGQLQEGGTENEVADSNERSAINGEEERAGEEGLEAIMEESEPSESDDDEYFGIHPIPELKPVSTLSFSSNQFSYFPMGRAHKQAYQAVRQKAVGPAPPTKWGRSHRTPAKMAKRRKR